MATKETSSDIYKKYKRQLEKNKSHQPSPIVEGEKTGGKKAIVFLIITFLVAVLVFSGDRGYNKAAREFVKNLTKSKATEDVIKEKKGISPTPEFVTAKSMIGHEDEIDNLSDKQLLNVISSEDNSRGEDDEVMVRALAEISHRNAKSGHDEFKTDYAQKLFRDIAGGENQFFSFRAETIRRNTMLPY